jgi:hypothetical protein
MYWNNWLGFRDLGFSEIGTKVLWRGNEETRKVGFWDKLLWLHHPLLMLPPAAVYLRASVVARAQESKLVLGLSYLSDSIHQCWAAWRVLRPPLPPHVHLEKFLSVFWFWRWVQATISTGKMLQRLLLGRARMPSALTPSQLSALGWYLALIRSTWNWRWSSEFPIQFKEVLIFRL